MGELRDLFEDGMGGFRPSTDEALERTRQRAERRARNRRLLAASVALALAATTLSGLWGALRLGGDEDARPSASIDLRPVVSGKVALPFPPRDVVSIGDTVFIGSEDGRSVAVDALTSEIVGRYPIGAPLDVSGTTLWGIGPKQPGWVDLRALDVATGDVRTVLEIEAASVYDSASPGGRIALSAAENELVLGTTAGRLLVVDLTMQPPRVHPLDVPGQVPGPGPIVDIDHSRRGLWIVHEQSIRELTLEEGEITRIGSGPAFGAAATTDADRAYTIFIDGRFIVEGPGPRNLFARLTPLPRGEPRGAAIQEGALWVLSADETGEGWLTAYHPGGGHARSASVRLSGSRISEGGSLAAAAGTLWVQDRSNSQVFRVEPHGDPAADAGDQPTGQLPDADTCPPPDLVATFVPSGIEPPQAQPGMGGGADRDGQVTNVVHFGDSPGPDGLPAPFLEIFRTGPDGGPFLPEDHARRFGEPIEVLGGEGYLVSIEDGWGVWFEHGDDPCNGYEIHAYAPTKAETRRFAEGLAPTVRGERDPGACPAPEVRATDLPPDFSGRAWPGAGAWAATGTPPPHPGDAGAIHYRGGDRGRFIEIRRRSAEDISLVHYPEGRLEEVLGQPAISGPSINSLRAYAVEFSLGAGRCPVHVVLGAGVSPDEVERFAEGLRAT